MKTVIALFGVLIGLAGLTILIVPDKFKNAMNRWTGQPRFLFAIVIGIVFGALLLAEAANLRYSLVMKIIGGISLLAAVVLLLAGRQRMDRFIDWWLQKSDKVLRAWSVFAIAFGGFLIYVTT